MYHIPTLHKFFVSDQMGNRNIILKSEEMRGKINRIVANSAGISEDGVRRHRSFLSLDDQNHANCQHHRSLKSSHSESLHSQQPANVIEFLIFYGKSLKLFIPKLDQQLSGMIKTFVKDAKNFNYL